MTFEALIRDLRYAARTLGRDRGWTTAALLTLALGIGGCTALFTVVESVVLRPLSFPRPDDIAVLEFIPGNDAARAYWDGLSEGSRASRSRHTTFPQYQEWSQESGGVFQALGVVSEPSSYRVPMESGAERFTAVRASSTLFRVLDVPPALGRWTAEVEDRPEGPGSVLVSHSLWQTRFGGDPGVLGKKLSLRDRIHTVVGVMPRDFAFPDESVQLWVSMAGASVRINSWNYRILGRLRDDVPLAGARSRLESLRVSSEWFDGTRREWQATAHSLHEEVVAPIRRPLFLLLAASATILLIACVNVVNLMLARASGREAEQRIRAALGAPPRRLAQQFLMEGTALGLTGGVLGLLLAHLLTEQIVALTPTAIPRSGEVGVDLRVLGFTTLLALGSGMAVGLLPACRALRGTWWGGSRLGVAGATTAGKGSGLGEGLVVGQIALSVILLACGALLLRSFTGLLAVERGFDPSHVLSFETELPPEAYPDPESRVAFYEGYLGHIGAHPRVRAAAVATYLPGSGEFHWVEFQVPGYASAPHEEFSGERFEVSEAYFEAMGIPLVEGRSVSSGAVGQGAREVVISQSMARAYWSGRSPLGSELLLDSAQPHTVVGVAGDVRFRGTEHEVHRIYLPLSGASGWMDGLVRVEGRAAAPGRELRALATTLDPRVAVFGLETLDARLSKSLAEPRFRTVLLVAFGMVASFLATMGIFGVVSYTTSRQTPEYGIRKALGAGPGRIWGHVLLRGLRLASWGVGLGSLGAYLAAGSVGQYLVGVDPRDPYAFGACITVILLLSVLASLAPAARAGSTDLMAVMRGE